MAVTVAFGDTIVAAFVAASADLLGGLRFDEFLQRPLGELAYEIDAVTSMKRVKKFGRGQTR